MSCQILLNQLEPIRRYIRSKDSHHFRFSDRQDLYLGKLLFATAKTGHHDLAQEILDLGACDNLKHTALEEAFEREDISMVNLLLAPRYRHTLEISRRDLIESLIVRSTQLDLRSMTNTLLSHAEYMSLDFIHKIFGIACYNGDNDLVRRLFAIHRYLDVNKQLGPLDWSPDLCYVHTISPLEITASKGHESTLRLLLEKGADPNATCAMEGAARGGHVGIARILHEAGAHPSAEDWVRVIKSYTYARMCKAQNGRFISFILDENMLDIHKYLRQSPRVLYEMIFSLCYAEDVAAVRLFSAHGMPMFGALYSKRCRSSPMYIAKVLASQELKETLKELGAPGCERPVAVRPNRQPYYQQYPFSPREISYSCSQFRCEAHAHKRWHRHRIY
ncbi:ankyrin repeat containing protein [Apiospora saccharicola]